MEREFYPVKEAQRAGSCMYLALLRMHSPAQGAGAQEAANEW